MQSAKKYRDGQKPSVEGDMVSRNQGHGDVGIFLFRINFCACLEACVPIFEINAKNPPI